MRSAAAGEWWKMRTKQVAYALLLGLLVGGGMAIAQDADAPDEEDVQSEIEVRRRADLSPEEQLAEAERIRQRGGQISQRIQAMLDEARRERDIIRVTCLNDKLTQVNANLRTLEQRTEALQGAVQGQDASRRNHEFTVITVLDQKFNVLEQEANQCIGQDLFETGATRVTTTVDPATPEEDPTVISEVPPIGVPFIPPPISPGF